MLSHRRLRVDELVHRELPSHQVDLEERHLCVHFEELVALKDGGVECQLLLNGYLLGGDILSQGRLMGNIVLGL
jgi:hypothetical protein